MTATLPDFDHPHGWTWRNDMRVPSSIHVEPAFKRELGDVFIRIDDTDGEHKGIWLPRDVMEEFIAAMRKAADGPEFDEDGED
jgi:hypothetical protein